MVAGVNGGPASDATVAAFFDVDNTIIRGASSFYLARGLQQRGYFGFADLARFAVEQLKYQLFGESKEQVAALKREALTIIKGWSVAEMAAVGEEIYDEVLASRIYPGTRDIIKGHLAKGHEVWLVTAAPVEIGRLIARRVGCTGALGTVAEHKDGYYTGTLVGDMLHGPAKQVAVRDLADERGIALDESYAYGDSMNDVPMLESVGHPTAINPEPRLRKLANKRTWGVHEFRDRNTKGRRGIVKSTVAGSVWIILAVFRILKATLLAPWRAWKGRKGARRDDVTDQRSAE